jgi:hypothetical protein
MFTRITQLLQKNRRTKILFLSLCFALLSFYPIFRSFYYGNGISTYKNQIAWLENRSPFYNPWQYRVLCPMMVEGMLWVYDHTVDKVYPIEEKVHLQIASTTGQPEVTKQFLELAATPGALKYLIVFLFFRFIEHVVIFILAYALWSYFVRNDWLLFFGLLFLSMGMGNAGSVADLTFNTYIDNILYLLTACLIVYRRSPWWLLLIILFGAFNRETSIMIPFLYFLSCMDLSKLDRRLRWADIGFPRLRIWLLTAAQYLLFFTIFLGIRRYYGYRPQSTWKVAAGLPMLKLNLISADGIKSWFEMIGTFSVIPLIILYRFWRFPYLLRLWFVAIVPVWFMVHWLTVVTYQTRLFLVPEILIFIPMLLWLIENSEGRLPAAPLPGNH